MCGGGGGVLRAGLVKFIKSRIRESDCYAGFFALFLFLKTLHLHQLWSADNKQPCKAAKEVTSLWFDRWLAFSCISLLILRFRDFRVGVRMRDASDLFWPEMGVSFWEFNKGLHADTSVLWVFDQESIRAKKSRVAGMSDCTLRSCRDLRFVVTVWLRCPCFSPHTGRTALSGKDSPATAYM